MKLDNAKQNVVFYHANCYDGFLAAYAAWHELGDAHADYVPISYGDPIDVAQCKDKRVYMVDFSVPYDTLTELASFAAHVTVIDHHKTAEAELTGRDLPRNVNCLFDMNKAGCTLAAEYFADEPGSPWYFKYVADRDLWTFEYPETKAFCAGFFAEFPLATLTFEQLRDEMGEVYNQFESKSVQFHQFERLCDKGQELIEYRNTLMEGWAKHARICAVVDGFDERRYMAVIHNIPRKFVSDMAHLLLERHSQDVNCVAVVSNRVEEGADFPSCSISLRSDAAHVDVSEIAKSFGGGGHRNAAGCELSYADAFEAGLFS